MKTTLGSHHGNYIVINVASNKSGVKINLHGWVTFVDYQGGPMSKAPIKGTDTITAIL